MISKVSILVKFWFKNNTHFRFQLPVCIFFEFSNYVCNKFTIYQKPVHSLKTTKNQPINTNKTKHTNINLGQMFEILETRT